MNSNTENKSIYKDGSPLYANRQRTAGPGNTDM
jgi:hypothetical protein